MNVLRRRPAWAVGLRGVVGTRLVDTGACSWRGGLVHRGLDLVQELIHIQEIVLGAKARHGGERMVLLHHGTTAVVAERGQSWAG